jgi:acyl carrier protein
MDKLELFNKVAEVVKLNSVTKYKPISTLDMPWADTNLDSLDAIMMCVYLSEIYNVEEETSKEFVFTTPRELIDLVEANKTTEPESLDAAIAGIV